MPRKYNIKTPLRMISNEMLEAFFAHIDAPLPTLDWNRCGRQDPEPILRAIEWHQAERVDEIDSALQVVFDLACTAGMLSLYAVGRRQGFPDLAARLPEDATIWERATCAWMWNPDLCEEAALLAHARNLRYWRKRLGLPRVDPRTDHEALRRFGDEISALLRREQGRGRHCSVEHYANGVSDLYFVYPDDYARTINVHDEEGDLTTRIVRSTFEMIFSYDRSLGTLDVRAKDVPKRLREQCEESFGREILGEPLEPVLDPRAYDVDRLVDSRFRFRTDPADRMHFTVEALDLEVRGRKRKISVGIDPNVEPGGIHAAIRESIREEVVVDLSKVHGSRLRVDCNPHGGSAWHLRVGLTPTSCTVRTERPDRQALIEKNLRLSGLAHV